MNESVGAAIFSMCYMLLYYMGVPSLKSVKNATAFEQFLFLHFKETECMGKGEGKGLSVDKMCSAKSKAN